MRTALAHFILEREQVRKNHDLKLARPWTNDPILQKYRFCNIRREDDRVTRWLRKRWRKDHTNVELAMLLARMVNWPPTLEELGFPYTWQPKRALRILQERAARGEKVWGSAYVITTCGRKMEKDDYVVNIVLNEAAKVMPLARPGMKLEQYWSKLRQIPGLGAGFIAAQVVADLKFTQHHPLCDAKDWWTWAVPGPGSRRGIQRYFNNGELTGRSTPEFLRALHDIMEETWPLLVGKIGPLHAQDWQNCLCEWDKYMRVVRGEGKPKSLYKPERRYKV